MDPRLPVRLCSSTHILAAPGSFSWTNLLRRVMDTRFASFYLGIVGARQRWSSFRGTSSAPGWSEVKTLLSAYLPHEAVAQNQPAAIPQQPVTSDGELAEPEQRG